MSLTRTQLVDAAEELNRVFEPPINVRAPVSTLKIEIRAASETLQESDQVSPGTAAVLRELNPEVKMRVEIDGPTPPTEEGMAVEETGASRLASQVAPKARKRSGARFTSRYEGSLSQRFDNAFLAGGTWEQIIALASTPERRATLGHLKSHMRWRQSSGVFRFEEGPGGIRMFRIEGAEAAE